jgi:hypothetical protein
VCLEWIVEAERGADTRDVEAIAARFVESLSSAKQSDISQADSRTRRQKQQDQD